MAELVDWATTALNHEIDKITLDSLLMIQDNLRRIQSQLVRWLEDGEITPDGYLEMFNRALRVFMAESRSLLGDERFQQIFGEVGNHPERLVDRDTFIQGFN